MFFKLVLLFTIVPMIELALLINIGGYIGTWYTLLIVGSTGIVGVALAKSQGFLILKRAREDLSNGILPGDQMINGVMVLIGGAFLLTPGLVTDTAGFLLILPGSRDVIRGIIIRKLRKMIEDGSIYIYNNRE